MFKISEVLFSTSHAAKILGCLYTRHYDGFVRQQWVRTILDAEHLWVAPFVIQLLGEYVPEIIDDIAEALRARPAEPYGRFITEKPSSTHSSGNEQSATGTCTHGRSIPFLRLSRVLAAGLA